MKRLIFLFSLLVFQSFVFSQQAHFPVTGKVIDKSTGAVLQGASVFAQNTTFGMATNADGKFKLNLPNGGYDFVVTYTGYTTESIRINTSSVDKELVIELNPQQKSLEEVSVVFSNEVKDGWIKYGQLFTDNFIGKSVFSRQTKILNPDVLKFYFSKKRDRLKVIANEPLIVYNDALGYTIKFSIDSFTHEFANNITQFIGYPLFEEMAGTQDQQALWKQNRLLAYNGSVLHFMRSFYNKRLSDEGFELQLLVKNNDHEVAIQVKDAYEALNYLRNDSLNVVEFYPNQPDVAVIYNKAKPQQEYLSFDPGAKKNFQVSTITIALDQSIIIEENGYFYDQTDLTINGYWAFEKVGDMLPYDYVPELPQ